jgi:hypothetical protein
VVEMGMADDNVSDILSPDASQLHGLVWTNIICNRQGLKPLFAVKPVSNKTVCPPPRISYITIAISTFSSMRAPMTRFAVPYSGTDPYRMPSIEYCGDVLEEGYSPNRATRNRHFLSIADLN